MTFHITSAFFSWASAAFTSSRELPKLSRAECSFLIAISSICCAESIIWVADNARSLAAGRCCLNALISRFPYDTMIIRWLAYLTLCFWQQCVVTKLLEGTLVLIYGTYLPSPCHDNKTTFQLIPVGYWYLLIFRTFHLIIYSGISIILFVFGLVTLVSHVPRVLLFESCQNLFLDSYSHVTIMY